MKNSQNNSNFIQNSLLKFSPKNIFIPALLIFVTIILFYSSLSVENINWGGDRRFYFIILAIVSISTSIFLSTYKGILRSMQKDRYVFGIINFVIFLISTWLAFQALNFIKDGVYPISIFYSISGISLLLQIQSFLSSFKIFNRLNYLSIFYFLIIGIVLEQSVSDVIRVRDVPIPFLEILSIIGFIITFSTLVFGYKDFVKLSREGFSQPD